MNFSNGSDGLRRAAEAWIHWNLHIEKYVPEEFRYQAETLEQNKEVSFVLLTFLKMY